MDYTMEDITHHNIMTLSVSGAGKTVFLACMHEKLLQRGDLRSFFLRADDPLQRQKLVSAYNQVNKPGTVWPSSTLPGETNMWSFTCRVRPATSEGGDTIYDALKLNYWDFPGEALTESRIPEVEKAIKSADIILVMLDGIKVLALMHKKQTMPEEERADIFVNKDLPNLASIVENSGKPIHFLISKWDLLHREQITLDTVSKRLMEIPIFRQLVQNHKGSNATIRLIPVSSVGIEGFVEPKSNGKVMEKVGKSPEPFQVEMPLACILPDKFRARESVLQRQKEQIEKIQPAIKLHWSLKDRASLAGGFILRVLRLPFVAVYKLNVPGSIGSDFVTVLINRAITSSERAARAKEADFKHELEILEHNKESALKVVKDEQSALTYVYEEFKRFEWVLTKDFPASRL